MENNTNPDDHSNSKIITNNDIKTNNDKNTKKVINTSNNNVSGEINANGKIKTSNAQFIKMTTEPVPKLLATLAIPSIISMLVTNIYNIVDTAFVGTLGTSQSGATGIVFGFMALLQAVAFMCGQGSGSIMSRKLGSKENEEATKYSSTGFFLSFSWA